MTSLFNAMSKIAVAAALVSAAATAAAAELSEAQARYLQQRENCLSGRSHQDRTTCLQEAGAALQEARRGSLGDDDPRQYERNRLIRCDVHRTPDDREDCLRRMRGEGTVSGSVESGGIYRELRTIVPAD